MKISTKGRYALRVMIDLAEHNGGAFIPLRDIAARQEISEKYLESIISVLVKDGILTGLRGKGGGYRLSQPAESITVARILTLTEGNLAPGCLPGLPAQRLSTRRRVQNASHVDGIEPPCQRLL